MTCVVAKDGVIRADRKQVGPHLCAVKKTWDGEDGSIFADAGDGAWGAIFKEWYLGGRNPEKRDAIAKLMHEMAGDVIALQVLPDQTIVLWVSPFMPLPMMGKTYGVGSGSPYALGAISAGASLEDAIRIASLWDEYTGAESDVITLADAAPPKGRRKRR